MRIGVDARPLRENQTSGIPRYVQCLLSRLSKIDKKNEYILYAHKEFQFREAPQLVKKYGALTRYGSVWMQAELPFWLKRDGIDMFWGTQHVLPLAMDNKIKSVLTVHDLVHYVFPETMKPMNLFINKLLIPPSIKKTNAIMADSSWTLLDVKKYLNPPAKIMEVVHLGVGESFYPRDADEAREKIRKKFNLPMPFILTLGTFEPRKNIRSIFKALSLIYEKIPHHFAIVGQKGWKNKDVIRQMSASQFADRIHFLGYVSDEDIPDIYAAADMFIFPSLYEGFGFPLLEAMACGVPVIASNVSSIPEVVGQAAHLIDPLNPNEIAAAIIRVGSDQTYRSGLIQKGIEQAAQFRWDKTAQMTLDIFNQLDS